MVQKESGLVWRKGRFTFATAAEQQGPKFHRNMERLKRALEVALGRGGQEKVDCSKPEAVNQAVDERVTGQMRMPGFWD